MLANLLVLVSAYLVGAFPTAALCAYSIRGVDIRQYGSGNSGATNASRLLGPNYFFAILLFDICKALYFLRFLQVLSIDWIVIYWAAIILVIGNGISIFLRGRGGKGVATSIGVLAFCCPIMLLPTLVIWAVNMAIWRNIGIASVISVICLPFIGYLTVPLYLLPLIIFISLWIIYRHAENIVSFLAY